ncbi:hypothetical protein L4C34_19445 [Vibrio profundum]|uniref:hypothetical protein n=1 Tax=Vibrio profundum TaxID=2910247 RepID=UPI003D0A3271
MHFEYAAEYVMGRWEDGLTDDKALLAELAMDQILALAEEKASEICNDKIVSIVANMRECEGNELRFSSIS